MGAYQVVRFIIYSLLDILSLMIVVRALLSFFVMMAGSELRLMALAMWGSFLS